MSGAVLALMLATGMFPVHRAAPPVAQPLPRTVTVDARVSGQASWFCLPGRSACTHGYPASGMYAAAGPALRVGHWRGRLVTLRANGRSVRVRLTDWCQCYGRRVIDVYASAFVRLAPLSGGVVTVKVSW